MRNFDDYYGDKLFATLAGETIVSIDGMEKGSTEVRIVTKSARTFTLHHEQDCCEDVRLEDVAGEVDDLIGSPITMAEVVSEKGEPKDKYDDSQTWTFYKLATVKGYVTLRWLGESNGYYSENVTCSVQEPKCKHGGIA